MQSFLFHAENDFSDVFEAPEHGVSLFDLGNIENLINTRLYRAVLEVFPHVAREVLEYFVFSVVRAVA